MKINEKAIAHSLATVSALYYAVCVVLVFVAPDLYKNVVISWAHGVDIARVWRDTSPDSGTLLVGFITFTAAAWLTGYIFAYIYNFFIKSK